MINKINTLFGRLLLLLLFCSPLIIAGSSAPRYKLLVAEELSYQFIQEAYDVGITEDSFLHYTTQMYQLGYTPILAIEGISSSFSHDEIITEIVEEGRVEIHHTDFFSCELKSKGHTFRIGGAQ